ncbi:MAG: substrate-binding domain-containing protein [Xanthobacteraceae bacterium]
MPAHKHTMLQICIICVLCYVVGLRLVWRYPEFFNGAGHNSTDRFITLGSATSTEDSGFFDHVLPIFQAATGLDVHVEAVGTGHALAIGAHGGVDAVLVHDRVGEENFVADGYGIDRRDVMYNDFVIVGPRVDPAGIRGMKDAQGICADRRHRCFICKPGR